MRRRSRVRRVLQWGGVGLSALTLAVWTLSFLGAVAYTHTAGSYKYHVGFVRGLAKVGWRDAQFVNPEPGWLIRWQPSNPVQAEYWLYLTTGIRPGGPPRVVNARDLVLPLWIPFLVLALPTAFLFWRGRCIQPGHCCRCGHDLAGNVGGVCPECQSEDRSGLSRVRRFLKWAGLGLSSLILAALVVSIYYRVSVWCACTVQSEHGVLRLTLSGASLRFQDTRPLPPGIGCGAEIGITKNSGPAAWLPSYTKAMSARDMAELMAFCVRYKEKRRTSAGPPLVSISRIFVLPLWMPFVLVAVLTAVLFWRDRRHPIGSCQRCGYNLTGNTTGVCPECGSRA